MTTKNIVPRATGEGSLGTAAKKWGNIYADYITLADGETLQTKIANQNTRITTAEGTVTTLSGDVTTLYGSVETLSNGKVDVSTYNTDMAKKVDKVPITDNVRTEILGGTEYVKGSYIQLFGVEHIGAGKFNIGASNGTTYKELSGEADGTLTWGGKNVEIVVASGTNYIRYASGMQVCWGNDNVASGNAVNFPIAFKSAPVVCMSNNLDQTFFAIDNGHLDYFAPYFTTTGNKIISYIAIGWW